MEGSKLSQILFFIWCNKDDEDFIFWVFLNSYLKATFQSFVGHIEEVPVC